MPTFIIVLYKLDTYLKYLHVSQIDDITCVCVAVLRLLIHGQLCKGRRTSCNQLQCSIIANSFNFFQNIPDDNFEKVVIYFGW